jgi:hypothetical protein
VPIERRERELKRKSERPRNRNFPNSVVLSEMHFCRVEAEAEADRPAAEPLWIAERFGMTGTVSLGM